MSEQRAQPGPQQQAQQRQQGSQPARAPQARPPRSDLSRDELRAHLANVESQIKSALRIIASESKGSQQAHSALRADLSSALVRLQADMNGSASDLSAKIDRLGAEVSFLNRQRRIGRVIFLTFGMTLSFILGVLVIVSWMMIKEGAFQSAGIPVPIEEMFERPAAGTPASTVPQPAAPTPVLDQRPSPPPQRPAAAPPIAPAQSAPRATSGVGILPPAVQQQPTAIPAPQVTTGAPPQGIVPPTVTPLPAQTQAQPELPPGVLGTQQR